MAADCKTDTTRRFSTVQLTLLTLCFLITTMVLSIALKAIYPPLDWYTVIPSTMLTGFVIFTQEPDYFFGLLHERRGNLEKAAAAYSRQIRISEARLAGKSTAHIIKPRATLEKCYARRAAAYEKLGEIALAQKDREMTATLSIPSA